MVRSGRADRTRPKLPATAGRSAPSKGEEAFAGSQYGTPRDTTGGTEIHREPNRVRRVRARPLLKPVFAERIPDFYER